jgi:aryl-alcohol dehydrogenase-like predicted oxidoreductase
MPSSYAAAGCPYNGCRVRYRKLGKTQLEVSDVGHGTWGMGGDAWKGGTDRESLAALRRSFELGLNFVDTALVYGKGHSERLLGHVLHQSASTVYVASKVPPLNMQWPARPGIGIEEVFPYRHIVESTEASLRNLGRETLDVQQLHVWNPEWTGSDEWRRAFEDLKKSGKVRFAGVSINSLQPDTALDLIRTGLIDTLQVVYNIFEQAPEQNLFPLCLEENVGVIIRCPLDEGALTGTITEDTQFDPDDYRARYFGGDRKTQVVRRVAALEEDLAGVDGSLAEIALRFCLSPAAVSTVIPGMRRVRNVEANCAASDIGPLDSKTLGVLRRHEWIERFRG